MKRLNSMACFESGNLRFVDLTNFIASGSNYAGYLKAYGVEEPIGFFPYEWVDGLDKLKYNSLPPQAAFYSLLKQKGISDGTTTVMLNHFCKLFKLRVTYTG